MKCMEGSKENRHWDLGSVGVNVNFRALEKSIWVLEKPWKSPGNLFLKKGTNPDLFEPDIYLEPFIESGRCGRDIKMISAQHSSNSDKN